MSIEVHYLNDSDSLTVGSKFEPHQQQYHLLVVECGELVGENTVYTLTSTAEVLEAFSDNAGLGTSGSDTKFRFKTGYAMEFTTDGGSNWNLMTRPTEMGRWIVRSMSCTPHPQREHAYDITITETNMGRLASNDSGDDPQYRGDIDVSVNITSTGARKKVWRTNATLPTETRGEAVYTDGDGSNVLLDWCPEPWTFCHTGDDIGGYRVDINGGQPIDITYRSEQITIEWVIRHGIWLWDETYAEAYVNDSGKSPNLAVEELRTMIGRRNWDNFGLYDSGYLLMTDLALQPLHHEFKRVVMTLVYDEEKHAQQRPFVTKSGILSTEDTCDGETTPQGEIQLVNLSAWKVGWIQPFLQGFSFGPVPKKYFNTDAWDTIYRYLNDNPSSYSINAEGTCD